MSDNLNINNSPGGLEEKPKPIMGKYLNKKPIAAVMLVLCVILFAIMYAVMQRSNNTRNNQAEITYVLQPDNTNSLDNMLEDLKKNDFKPGANNSLHVNNQELQPQSVDVYQSDPMEQRLAEEKLKILLHKQDMLNKAIMSGTSVDKSFSTNKNTNSYTAQQNYPSYLDSSTNSGSGVSGASLTSDLIKSSILSEQSQMADNQVRNEGFFDRKHSYNYLEAQKSQQISQYEIKTGTIIPGVLITGINSDLPGQILAQVRENVYDTATGKHLLIPQGSKLVGFYSASVQYGQRRVLIAWGRLIYPDGATLDLGAMNGIDQMGYAGFEDQINNHYLRIFSSALLFSGIIGGMAVADDGGNQYKETNKDKMYAAIISEMGQVSKQMIEKNMNIAPTIEIRPGYRFNVFVTKDIILEPLSY